PKCVPPRGFLSSASQSVSNFSVSSTILPTSACPGCINIWPVCVSLYAAHRLPAIPLADSSASASALPSPPEWASSCCWLPLPPSVSPPSSGCTSTCARTTTTCSLDDTFALCCTATECSLI